MASRRFPIKGVSLIDHVPATTSLESVTTEILYLKRATATNIIEIGKRLIAAKEMVGHGGWSRYLEERVEFSEKTARRFIRTAEVYTSNPPALADLEPTKVYLLLEAPEEERQVLTDQAAEMTTRQLEEAVRAANASKREADEFKRKLAEAESRPPKVVERTVEVMVPDTKAQAEAERLRKEYQSVSHLLSDTGKALEELRQQTNRSGMLDAEIREKEQQLKELIERQRQMSVDFYDAHRNPDGGEKLMAALLPMANVIHKVVGDVVILRQAGVGGPCDDKAVKEFADRLRQLAVMLDSILKDRASRPINIQPVEVL